MIPQEASLHACHHDNQPTDNKAVIYQRKGILGDGHRGNREWRRGRDSPSSGTVIDP